MIQFPIGALSDRIDRRRLMLALTMAAASAAALIAVVDGHSFPLLLTLSLIMGGLIQPLYALSIAQTYDYLEPGGGRGFRPRRPLRLHHRGVTRPRRLHPLPHEPPPG